jgi:lysophospholipid acyltransferase (LPLAT)-like uncharacterized protein
MSTSPASPDPTPDLDPNAAASDPRVARRARRLGRAIYVIARLLYATLRLRLENAERFEPTGGAIFVTWHGRTLIPATYLRGRGYCALISLSRDGEMQNNFFRLLGYQTARGSTGRGGIKGLLQMARRVKGGGVLVMTPDGPRGPTHKVQLGVILMAEKSGAPIIPVAVSADRRWLMKSWDSYMLPKPFAKVPLLTGEPIVVPPNLDDAGRRHYADLVEVAINRLEREAERRAGHLDYPADWQTDSLEDCTIVKPQSQDS